MPQATDFLEERARALDEARRIRLLKSEDIDTQKYLRAHDVTHKVLAAEVWLDQIGDELIAGEKDDGSAHMPWPKTQSRFRFRPGEVTLYAGSNGGGKSLVTGQIAMGLVQQGYSVCIASFEMKPKRTLYRMLRQFSCENIDQPKFTDKAQFVKKSLDRFAGFVNGRLWLYDQQGTVTTAETIAMTRYCAMNLEVKHVFIDSLMKCVSGEDDYNAQKMFVDEITAVARDHNIHVHLIHHIRKQTNDEIKPNKNDIKGTGAIADQVDNVLLVWRNKKKEHELSQNLSVDMEAPDAMLMCEKQRNGESEDWFNLWYHRDSTQFVDSAAGGPIRFDQAEQF